MIWKGRSEDPESVGANGIDDGGAGIDNGRAERPASASQDAQESVGKRVESVLDAAEQAAAGIREDAQDWARRYMEYSRHRADETAAQRVRELSQMTESLVTRAHAVAKQSDELIRALGQAGQQVSGNSAPPQEPRVRQQPARAGAAPAQAPARQQPPQPASAPAPAQAPAAAPPSASEARTKSSKSDGARQLVTRMTVAGRPREEISQRLQDEFDVADPGALLDELGL